MPPYKHLERYRQIVGILADEGLDDSLDVTGLRRFQPVHRRLRPEHDSRQPFGLRLRHTLERLGPTFVKLGQVASTRPDLIPDDVVAELRKLQDDVAPFPDAEAFAMIETELGGSIDEIFLEFDRKPLAAASLGQVYCAKLPDGTAVIVKVQRPNVEHVVEVDLDILMTQARFVAVHSELGATYDVVGITSEFAEAVRGELDYHAEGSNAERLGMMFADDDTVAFPEVFWEFSTSRVLTLERIDGLPFNKPDALSAAGMDRAELARRGIYCYLEQIFMHGYYHGDPHP
jgi:ubiquinone biosynthesis protein